MNSHVIGIYDYLSWQNQFKARESKEFSGGGATEKSESLESIG